MPAHSYPRRGTSSSPVVHAAVHVDEVEGVEMLVASEASIEHGLLRRGARPCVGVAHVAPSVEALHALHIPIGVGNRRPTTEVVHANIVKAV